MRGLIAVAALCGATLLAAGCGAADPATAGRGAPPPAQFVKASGPVGVSPDPKARAICDDLRGGVLDADAKAFGTELGRLTAARARSDRAAEGQAQQATTAKLSQIAGKLRTHAAEATDPQLRQALNASAVNLDKMGTDVGALANLDSLDAVSKTTGRFAAALGDAAEYCGA